MHKLVAKQFIPRPVDEVFAFFADPDNLARLTPPAMRFESRSDDRGDAVGSRDRLSPPAGAR